VLIRHLLLPAAATRGFFKPRSDLMGDPFSISLATLVPLPSDGYGREKVPEVIAMDT
jgi:hypothetical protein